ncbi:5-hydroxytryptamine receptor 1F [Myotis brandtii]|uniref:5-hydroxytryptamine receptor 1F n=1 Tax=Myotis brandtii TaxID=109478 RepID=S7Q2H4_MYOBR|nr:5-hydroxytryptamine receptor 1F [Myotis brandtii]
MQELSPGGQCTPTGGELLSQKLGSWLASTAAKAGASPDSMAAGTVDQDECDSVAPGTVGWDKRERHSAQPQSGLFPGRLQLGTLLHPLRDIYFSAILMFSNKEMDFLNSSDQNLTSEELLDRMPSKILVSLTLSGLALMTTTINSLVIAAIIVTRKLHHPANYLICSLAVTDFLVAVLVMPFSIVYIVKESWIMGQVVCDIWLSVDITCCTCSILHLSAIALDRYRAITDAVEYARKRTPKNAGIMITVVWIISVFISMPPLFWRHQGTSRDDECIIKHDHIVSTIYSTFGAFYIPLTLILILYYKIYKAAKTLYHKRQASRIVKEELNGQVLLESGEKSTRLVSTTYMLEKSLSDPSTDFDKIHSTMKSPRSEFKHEKSWRRQKISGTRERKAATTLGLILGAFVEKPSGVIGASSRRSLRQQQVQAMAPVPEAGTSGAVTVTLQSDRAGVGSGCKRWFRRQQLVRVRLTLAAGASARWDSSTLEQRIFSNHQRLAPMTVTGALPWSRAPAHLLHHLAMANAHHVLCSAACC